MTTKHNIERRLEALAAPEEDIPEMSSETFWMFDLKCSAVKHGDLVPERGPEIIDEDNGIVRYNGEICQITDETLRPFAQYATAYFSEQSE